MLIDAAKGLEPQTRKLFEVCQMRSLPIFTFVNKLDRPGREALELLDEIEQELGLQTYAVNWPIGMGDRFQGVFDRRKQQIPLFEVALTIAKKQVNCLILLQLKITGVDQYYYLIMNGICNKLKQMYLSWN